MEVSGQLHAPATLPQREIAPSTHSKGGWVGPRAVLEEKNSQPPPDIERYPTSIVQPRSLVVIPTEL
jgi:hypothetical protein